MGYKSIPWALKQCMSPTAKLVLVVIVNHYNERTKQCNPSANSLAETTGYTDRTVRQALRELEEIGCISCTPTFIDGRQTSNHYRINFEGTFPNLPGSPEDDSPQRMKDIHPEDEADSYRIRNLKGKNEHGNLWHPRSRASAHTVKESEYDSWPEDNRPVNKDPQPKKRKPTSRSIAIDFQREVVVQFGTLETTNVYALSGNIKKWNTAGISFAEIQACIEYFFKVPKRYMWNDVKPWVAFTYKFKEIRKDCDWTDPSAKTTVKRFERPPGSRAITRS